MTVIDTMPDSFAGGDDGVAAPNARPVLVVEDDAAHRGAIERALARDGRWLTASAACIAEARAALARATVTAVLLDVSLPDGDGTTLVAELTNAGIEPVIVLADAASLDVARRAMQAGAADIVVKADGFSELMAPVVQRAVEQSALARAAQEQRARIEALTQLNELKTEFLARLSHELRTPLTYVMGYAELLTTRTFEPAEAREIAEDILCEARELTGLVDTLLAVGEHERLGHDPVPSCVHLGSAVFAAWGRVAARERHALHLKMGPDDTVWADPELFEQAMHAVLDNAVRYSPYGGCVCVEATVTEHAVSVSVRDEGIGFDPGLADRLFEPFFRVEGDHTHRIRGVGLGLTTARAIVKAHGGGITARSDGPGMGTTVDVWLPVPTPP